MGTPTLKILQLRSHAGFYGVEKVVVELAAGLQARNHHVTVGIIQNSQVEDTTFRRVAAGKGLACKIFSSVKPFDQDTVNEVSRFIETERPDLVHSHGYKADVLAWLANRSHHLPLISTCHPWLDTATNFRAALYALIDKLVLLRFDRVVAVSEAVRRQCRVGPLKKGYIPVITNGVEIPAVAHSSCAPVLRRELHIPPASLLLGCVARMTHEKGHAFLIDAFASLSQKSSTPVELLLIGDGAERERLQQQCRNHSISGKVHFLGHRENVQSLLAQLDLFVLPSLTEGIPMALLEAMAAGVPAVATAVGGVPGILEEGMAGMVVPPGEPAALSAALLDLCENGNRRRELAQRGYVRVCENFSREVMCQRYEEHYFSLVRSREGEA